MTSDSTITMNNERAADDAQAPTSSAVSAENLSESKPQSFDVPRPMLSLAEAAAVLGKSMRSLERSLTGRWGNKLPEGWAARRVSTENGDEWRILPPPGFRVRQSTNAPDNMAAMTEFSAEPTKIDRMKALPRRLSWRPEHHRLDNPAIVIDRSEEVEHLLRELLTTQKALSEERRLHMEDMRIMAQLHSSMKLLESSASESARIKLELENTKKELEELKREYNTVINLPWWKRLFGTFTK